MRYIVFPKIQFGEFAVIDNWTGENKGQWKDRKKAEKEAERLNREYGIENME